MILTGDCRDVLPTLAAESVQCCVTSPPYWGLRDYGTAEWSGGDPDCSHEAKAARRATCPASGLTGGAATVDAGTILGRVCHCGAVREDSQIGLEATPEEYVEALVGVFREVRRVLRPDGTLWLNLGDSYATGAGKVGEAPGGGEQGEQGERFKESYFGKNGKAPAVGGFTQPNRMPIPGLKPKDLVGIPWRVALALQANGWYLRSDIIWHKPNPMPESVTDRPTKAHEYVFLLSKSERYFYDAEAIAEPAGYGHEAKRDNGENGHGGGESHKGQGSSTRKFKSGNSERKYSDAVGRPEAYLGRSIPWEGVTRNARSVWTIPTKPYSEAHFATFPAELARRCILAGSSAKGCCPDCGAPWQRTTEYGRVLSSGGSDSGERAKNLATVDPGNGGRGAQGSYVTGNMTQREKITTGWARSCNHESAPVPCVVLDPFNGAGTTGLVAQEYHREYVGIELNPKYVGISDRRLSQNVLPLLGS